MKKLFFAFALVCCTAAFASYKLELKVNKPDGVFKCGEKIVFSCRVLENGKPVPGMEVRYKFMADNQRMQRGKFISDGTWTKETKLDYPGWVRMEFSIHGKDGKVLDMDGTRYGKKVKVKSVGIGALTDPEKLLPVLPEPADFDEFWAGVRKELDAVPVKAAREEFKLSGKIAQKVVCYDVKVDCAGGMPVSGYLCMPKNAKPKSCPALLYYDGAGVRTAGKDTRMSSNGVITFNVNAHGIENGKPLEFYTKLRDGKYKGYPQFGKNDRDKFYFKGMYMRVMRSIDYIKSLPEWDGKHIIVCGGSQGGAQVFAACALDKDVTYAVASVPAMSDHSGCLANRRSGWPTLYKNVNGKPDNPAVAKAASYYDNAYFAKRVKCPINVNTGLFDNTCVPTSVLAVYNSIPETTQKWLTIVPDGKHDAHHTPGNKRRNEYILKAIKSNRK